jgi:hypothetical protein
VQRFPPKPSAPWLARKWDSTLAAVTKYRFQWKPEPIGERPGRVHPLLGREPAPGSRRHNHWARVAALVERNAVAITIRHLETRGLGSATIRIGEHIDGEELAELDRFASPQLRTRDRWLTEYLRYHTAQGIGAGTDFAALARWVDEVDAWRQRHSIDADQIIGILPQGDAFAAAEWRVLAGRAPLEIPPAGLAGRAL